MQAVEALGHRVAVALDEHLVVLALEVVADRGREAGAVLDQQHPQPLRAGGGRVSGEGGLGVHDGRILRSPGARPGDISFRTLQQCYGPRPKNQGRTLISVENLIHRK